jgi:antibiotic biosynthesis monooxygenase (ABM) superfamily enzyme
MTLIVLLWVLPERRAEFERFESRAAEIMRDHGGCIERRVGIAADAGAPDEVHVVTFPDAAAFDAYRSDPRSLSLSTLRAEAIRDTVVWRGSDLPAF